MRKVLAFFADYPYWVSSIFAQFQHGERFRIDYASDLENYKGQLVLDNLSIIYAKQN